jgi:hypothetical protein
MLGRALINESPKQKDMERLLISAYLTHRGVTEEIMLRMRWVVISSTIVRQCSGEQ